MLLPPVLLALAAVALSAYGASPLKVRAFEEWAARNGVHSKCAIEADAYGGLRLVASETIAPDEVFLEVPLRLCFSSGIRPEWTASLDWPAGIALSLLEQKAQDRSFWADYLEVLPSREAFASLPHNWPDDLISQCCYIDVEEETRKVRNWRQCAWNDVTALARQHQKSLGFDERTLGWALDCVATRNIKVEVAGSECMNVLAPYLDCMNHSPLVQSRFALVSKRPNEDSQAYFDNAVIQVKYETTGVEVGDEVFLNYGSLNACKAVCDYGFVPRLIPDDFVYVSIPRKLYVKHLVAELSPQAPSTPSRSPVALLRKLGIEYAAPFQVFADRVDEDMLVALVVLLADPRGLDVLWTELVTNSLAKSEVRARYLACAAAESSLQALRSILADEVEACELQDAPSELLESLKQTRLLLLRRCIAASHCFREEKVNE